MTKSDLITLLATKENLTEVQAARIVNLIFGGFIDALAKGERIESSTNLVEKESNRYSQCSRSQGE